MCKAIVEDVSEDFHMRAEVKIEARLGVLGQRIGQLGVQLLAKAILCAIGMGLLAGLVAALFVS